MTAQGTAQSFREILPQRENDHQHELPSGGTNSNLRGTVTTLAAENSDSSTIAAWLMMAKQTPIACRDFTLSQNIRPKQAPLMKLHSRCLVAVVMLKI